MASNSDYNYVRMKGNFFLASLTSSSTNFCHSKKLLGNQFYLIYMYLVNQIALVLLKPFVKKKKKLRSIYTQFRGNPQKGLPWRHGKPCWCVKNLFPWLSSAASVFFQFDNDTKSSQILAEIPNSEHWILVMLQFL